jgi:glycosyltransferase involved in cell wall biosynthesis
VKATHSPTVTVAILTYLRPSDVSEVIPPILAQAAEVTALGKYEVDVVVIDNDPAGSAGDIVRGFGAPTLRYYVEPRAGVSAARNRALDTARESDFLAFIDDDERPHPRWLQLLLETAENFHATAVAGRVVAEFEGLVDPWIAAGRFFVRHSLPTGTQVVAAGAGNLLLDMRRIRAVGLRFDEKFGSTGGEDTLFTRSLTALGEKMVWCDEAVITDKVPAGRMTRRWVLSRAWSHGNTATLVDLELAAKGTRRSVQRVRSMIRGVIRIVCGLARFLLGVIIGSQWHQARGLRAAWRGGGMSSGAVGIVFHEYARTAPPGAGYRRARILSSLKWLASSVRRLGSGNTPVPRDNSLTVLLPFPTTKPKGNPYRVLLEESLRRVPDLNVRNFSWRTAIFGRYDVFHVHWPEILVDGRDAVRKVLRQALFLALLVRLRITRTPIVRTVHNLELPKDISRREIALLEAAERQTALRIRINVSTELPPGQPFETVLHGHYREWFNKYQIPPSIPGRLVFFGLVRRYKCVDDLIRAFRQIDDDEQKLSLAIVGHPSSDELAASLHDLSDGDKRIDLLLEFVEDSDLVKLVGNAELVVLPYRDMHNSAGVLTALSLGRPVLIPDNLVNRALSQEVGPGWVFLYTGILTGKQIEDSIRSLRDHPPISPCDLSQRDWESGAREHLAAYRRAVLIESDRSREF